MAKKRKKQKLTIKDFLIKYSEANYNSDTEIVTKKVFYKNGCCQENFQHFFQLTF